MLNYLRNKAFVAEEADRLVAALDALAAVGNGRVSPAKLEKALARTAAAVGDRRLGWIGQSVLAHRVKWELIEGGHAVEWVEPLVQRLVVSCAEACARGAHDRRPPAA